MKQTAAPVGRASAAAQNDDVPRPMVTMFVRPSAVLPGDEIVLGTDKRYPVLLRLAAHNGHPKTAQATALVRRARAR